MRDAGEKTVANTWKNAFLKNSVDIYFLKVMFFYIFLENKKTHRRTLAARDGYERRQPKLSRALKIQGWGRTVSPRATTTSGGQEVERQSGHTVTLDELHTGLAQNSDDPVRIVVAKPRAGLLGATDGVHTQIGFRGERLSRPTQRGTRCAELLRNGGNSPTWVFIDHSITFGYITPIWVISTHIRIGDTDMGGGFSTVFQEFQIHSARSLASSMDAVPTAPGIYAAMIEDGDGLLAPHGFFDLEQRSLVTMGQHQVLYLGATSRGLSLRLASHLFGDARQSTLRMTLGGLLLEALDLTVFGTVGQNYYHFGPGEDRLTSWIQDHLTFAFRETDHPLDEEVSLIGTMRPPLNITQQRARPFAKRLMALRSDLSARWD